MELQGAREKDRSWINDINAEEGSGEKNWRKAGGERKKRWKEATERG